MHRIAEFLLFIGSWPAFLLLFVPVLIVRAIVAALNWRLKWRS